MKRTVRRIVIHCSAGPQTQTADAIIAYHLAPVSKGGRGWKAAGYHYIVEPSGRVVAAVPEELQSNGARGFNRDSIHICYIGGVDAGGHPVDNRTPAQRQAMRRLVAEIRARRGVAIPIVGHRDLSPDSNGDNRISPAEWIKACPSFDVATDF